MKILVTGGGGFIGSNLIKVLKDSNEVISLDNYSSGSEKNHHSGVKYIKANTCDIFFTELKDFNPDVVFHFGEFSRIVYSWENPERVYESNLRGSWTIIKYCLEKKAKLIYSATSCALEPGDQFLNPYAWSKTKVIEMIKNAERWFGLRYAICYFYNVYGNGQIEEGPYSTVVGIFQKCKREGLPLPVVLPGTQTRIFTHIDDIVKGIVLVFEKGEGDGYHLSSEEKISILDLAKMFNETIVYVPERKGERSGSITLPSRAKEELGWKAQTRLFMYLNTYN